MAVSTYRTTRWTCQAALVVVAAGCLSMSCARRKLSLPPAGTAQKEEDYVDAYLHAREMFPYLREQVERDLELRTNWAILEAQRVGTLSVRAVAPPLQFTGDDSVDMSKTFSVLLVADDIPADSTFLDKYDVRVGPDPALAEVKPAASAKNLRETDAAYVEEQITRLTIDLGRLKGAKAEAEGVMEKLGDQIREGIVYAGRQIELRNDEIKAKQQEREQLENNWPEVVTPVNDAIRERDKAKDDHRDAQSKLTHARLTEAAAVGLRLHATLLAGKVADLQRQEAASVVDQLESKADLTQATIDEAKAAKNKLDEKIKNVNVKLEAFNRAADAFQNRDAQASQAQLKADADQRLATKAEGEAVAAQSLRGEGHKDKKPDDLRNAAVIAQGKLDEARRKLNSSVTALDKTYDESEGKKKENDRATEDVALQAELSTEKKSVTAKESEKGSLNTQLQEKENARNQKAEERKTASEEQKRAIDEAVKELETEITRIRDKRAPIEQAIAAAKGRAHQLEAVLEWKKANAEHVEQRQEHEDLAQEAGLAERAENAKKQADKLKKSAEDSEMKAREEKEGRDKAEQDRLAAETALTDAKESQNQAAADVQRIARANGLDLKATEKERQEVEDQRNALAQKKAVYDETRKHFPEIGTVGDAQQAEVKARGTLDEKQERLDEAAAALQVYNLDAWRKFDRAEKAIAMRSKEIEELEEQRAKLEHLERRSALVEIANRVASALLEFWTERQAKHLENRGKDPDLTYEMRTAVVVRFRPQMLRYLEQVQIEVVRKLDEVVPTLLNTDELVEAPSMPLKADDAGPASEGGENATADGKKPTHETVAKYGSGVDTPADQEWSVASLVAQEARLSIELQTARDQLKQDQDRKAGYEKDNTMPVPMSDDQRKKLQETIGVLTLRHINVAQLRKKRETASRLAGPLLAKGAAAAEDFLGSLGAIRRTLEARGQISSVSAIDMLEHGTGTLGRLFGTLESVHEALGISVQVTAEDSQPGDEEAVQYYADPASIHPDGAGQVLPPSRLDSLGESWRQLALAYRATGDKLRTLASDKSRAWALFGDHKNYALVFEIADLEKNMQRHKDTLAHACRIVEQHARSVRPTTLDRIASGDLMVYRLNVLRGIVSTTAYLMPDDGVKKLFGEAFADTFYVAQVTIRNPNDKPIIVYGNTMKLIVLMNGVEPWNLGEDGKPIRKTWWATYEPLDYAAVLAMLEGQQEEGWRRRWSQVIDFASLLGSIGSVFTANVDYNRGVAAFSGVFAPWMKEKLEETLIRHHRNFLSFALPASMEIEAQSATTRHVFLPKGRSMATGSTTGWRRTSSPRPPIPVFRIGRRGRGAAIFRRGR